jgi:IS5 family transposase
MPWLGGPEMRHGRKTRTKPFNGYKRHVLTLVDQDLIVDAIARPANEPEHAALAPLEATLAAHGPLVELAVDRGYLASPRIGPLHAQGVTIRAKAWRSPNGDRFPKHAFAIDLRASRDLSRRADRRHRPSAATVHFRPTVCQPCAQRAACTTARAHSVSLHPHEALLQTLAAAQRQPAGRAALRECVVVEHTLARIGQIQGLRARYKGVRKNTLDLRRTAAVVNLQRIARMPAAA